MSGKVITGLVLTLSVFTMGYGQYKVSGKFVDTKNTPVDYLEVIISVKDSVMKADVTNKEGRFTFRLAKGNYKLMANYFGENVFQKELDVSGSLDLGVLQVDLSTKLKGVTVEGSKKLIELKEDKLIFHVENTVLNKGDDGLEVLQRAPGIWVSGSEIFIRQEPATILVNGRKVNLKGSFLADYVRNLEAENIQSIEIQTIASAAMDADVTGGIINIVLKKRPIGFNGNVKSYYTYYKKNLFSLYDGLSFNYGSKKWNAYLLYNFKRNTRGGNYDTELVIRKTGQSQHEKGIFENQQNTHNYQLGFVSKLSEKQDFGMEFYGTNHSRVFLPGYEDLTITENIPILKGVNIGGGQRKTAMYNAILNYTYRIDTLNGTVRLIGDYVKENLNEVADINSVYEFGQFKDNKERNTTDSNTDVYSVQADVKKTFFKEFKTDAGVKYVVTTRYSGLLSETLSNNNTWVSNNRTSKFDYKESIIAGYLSVGYNWNDKNSFKLGLRLEHTAFSGKDKLTGDKNVNSYLNWFPSVYYSRKLSKNTALSLSYSRRLWRPLFVFLNNRVNKLNDFSFDIGNPYLAPQFTGKYEIRLNVKKQSFAVYLDNTTDAINGVWRIENNISIHQNQNYGTRRLAGFEYSVLSNLTKWWDIKVFGQLYQRNFKNTDYDLKKITAFLYARTNFKINATTSFTIYGNYRSPSISSNYTNIEKYTVNLVLKKTFLNNKLDARFYIGDIFDSQRNESRGTFRDFYRNFYQKVNTRGFTIQLRYDFSTKNKAKNSRNSSGKDVKNRL